MLASVKPFSSPLYEDAALKNATLFALCKISTLLLQNVSHSAFRLCSKEGVEGMHIQRVRELHRNVYDWLR